MDAGKAFEQDFRNSVPEHVFVLRLKDTAGWSNAENTRFSSSNLCDFIMFDGSVLYLVEVKSHLGKSIPHGKLKQVGAMKDIVSKHVVPCFVLNFRGLSETYMVRADRIAEVLEERKSVPVDFCRKEGLFIPQRLKRTRWSYDLEILFGEG
jgi:recombination protein U